MNLKVLFLGDIVGKIGRRAVIKILPELKKEYDPDLVIANAENLAHGKGVTRKALEEVLEAGIDFFTSGNHIWKKKDSLDIFQENKLPIIRPANYPPNLPGDGFRIIEVGSKKVLILNLIGRVFMHDNFDCPFRKFDEIMEIFKKDKIKVAIVDFHGEVTSETKALGFYADGRISAFLGTHTHIQTADEQILPGGTAYITDAGMVGAKDSVIGVEKQGVIKAFITQLPVEHEVPESGLAIVRGVYLEVDGSSGKARKIERIVREVEP